MRKIIGDGKSDDKNMQRYCAYMGERLLSVYLSENKCTIYSAPLRYKRWWLSVGRKIAKIVGIKNNSKIYVLFKNIGGYKSSYK